MKTREIGVPVLSTNHEVADHRLSVLARFPPEDVNEAPQRMVGESGVTNSVWSIVCACRVHVYHIHVRIYTHNLGCC